MQIITTTKELEKTCQSLARSEFIAVDTEFLREKTYWAELCLIQIAGDHDAVIIDPLADGIDLAPFFDLMRDTSVLKVFHAGRQDIEIIYNLAAIIPAPLADTQIIAMVCGHGESVGYGPLVQNMLGITVDKSSRFTDWSRRPLSPEQLEYALKDVTYLRQIYPVLAEQAAKAGRSGWVAEEMTTLCAPETYQQDPETAWCRVRKNNVRNKKALGILIEIAKWREELAQAKNIPKGRVLRDEALIDIAERAPVSLDGLARLRSINKGFARSKGALDLLQAVNRGRQREAEELPVRKRKKSLTDQESAIADLLAVLLKAVAARSGVAAKLIANREDIQQLARVSESESSDCRLLHGWRQEIFGKQALDLKSGRCALTIDADGLKVISLNKAQAPEQAQEQET